MKIIAKRDKQLEPSQVERMLESLRKSYEGVTPVEWTQQEIDGSEINWEVYSGDDKGISKSKIRRDTNKLWNKYGYGYDHVIYFMARNSWEAHGIGGWNLGKLYNDYAVQIVLAEQSGKWAGKTLEMEVAHAFDELAPVELGVDLNKYKKIGGVYLDYDIYIVHGEHPEYGVKQDDGTFFTDYDYTKLINDFSTVISNIYEERRTKEKKERIRLMKKLVRLYRKHLSLRQLLKSKKPTPAPLEGGHAH